MTRACVAVCATLCLLALGITGHASETAATAAATSNYSTSGDSASGDSTSSDSASVDPAARWHKLLAEAGRDEIYDTFALTVKLRGDTDSADATACRDNAAAIDAALRINTVGLSLWYGAYQCAVVLGQEDVAARRLQVFSTLVRYAVESRPPDNEQTPIRVLSPLDVEAFVSASGQKVLYSYFETHPVGRALPMHISLWDAETKRERLLTFDFLDSRMHLARAKPEAEFPSFRRFFTDALLESFGKQEGSPAAYALQLRKAFLSADVAKRMQAIVSSAERGDFGAVMKYARACLVLREQECGHRAVDLLLPWAENFHAAALIMLAIAYDEGNGVERDADKARALVRAADRRLGGNEGSLLFLASSIIRAQERKHGPLTKDIMTRLAKEHVPLAETYKAIEEMARGHDELGAESLAGLRHAAGAHIGLAQRVLGKYLIAHDSIGHDQIGHDSIGHDQVGHAQAQEGLRWLQDAAAADDPYAQQYLARAYEKGELVAKDLEMARQWYAEAGRGGDEDSMVWMGHYFAALPRNAKNLFGEQGWLQSAALAGSVQGALDLAQLYAGGGEGIEGDSSNSAQIYKELDQNFNNAEARRRLAEMLVYSTNYAHDSTEAERLLHIDADRGDVASQVKLGWMLSHGVWGKERADEGRKMLQQAAATGDVGALVEYGNTLYYGAERQRREGMELWQRAWEKGNGTAGNNIAWALCTSADPQMLDGARGLEVAKALDKGDATPVSFIDTIAACYARVGDFEKAAAVEQGAQQQAQAHLPHPERFVKMAGERIALFKQGKAYSEEEAKLD